jgi:pyridoxal phosphate enzyme (YggS family)
MLSKAAYDQLLSELKVNSVSLVAVSKTKSAGEIQELYDLGQRDFGENYVQELVKKAEVLPADIRWHFIGHLQSNKVKLIIPLVQLIQSVDSLKLLEEINKQAAKASRVIDCLLQVHIASEETKFGLDEKELGDLFRALPEKKLEHVRITGLMGMASFTEDAKKIKEEFSILKRLYDTYRLQTLSMGMTSDYKIAIEEGSNMVRIGSLLFGNRTLR